MNRDRVDAQLANLERLMEDGDPPPLLSLVVLANGLGLAHQHTLMRKVEASSLDELEGALRIAQVCLADFVERIEDQLSVLASARLAEEDRFVQDVIESL